MRCRRAGKVMHRTVWGAEKARDCSAGKNLNIYLCEYCQHFHLGHDSRAAGDFDRQAKIDRLLGKSDGRPRTVTAH